MDPYRDIAPFYDLEHDDFRGDVDFYLEIVRASPVLIAGVGTGRVMHPLVEAGHQVWGVDVSPSMVALARERVKTFAGARIVETSITRLEMEVRFATSILPLNVLWHLATLADQLAALRAIRRHQMPDGQLIVATSNPLTLADREANGELRQRFTREDGGRTILGLSAAWDSEADQSLVVNYIYEVVDSEGAVRRTVARLPLRYVYRNELELLLLLAGFKPLHFYGSFELDAYEAGSPYLIAVASCD